MTGTDRPTRRPAWAAFLAAALATPGCAHLSVPSAPEATAPSLAIPAECRNRLHVYLINGCDLAGCADFASLRERLGELGFTKVHSGELYDYFDLACSLKEVKRDDPDARIALVGYSLGANAVRHLARNAGDAGIPVELVVYLDAVCLPGNSLAPPSACRVLNVFSPHKGKQAPQVAGAENIELPPTGHFSVPTHPAVVEILAQELSALAAVIPLPPGGPRGPLPGADEPTPRPLPAPRPVAPPGFEYLAPVGAARDG
jgi:hypothetical protein